MFLVCTYLLKYLSLNFGPLMNTFDVQLYFNSQSFFVLHAVEFNLGK